MVLKHVREQMVHRLAQRLRNVLIGQRLLTRTVQRRDGRSQVAGEGVGVAGARGAEQSDGLDREGLQCRRTRVRGVGCDGLY